MNFETDRLFPMAHCMEMTPFTFFPLSPRIKAKTRGTVSQILKKKAINVFNVLNFEPLLSCCRVHLEHTPSFFFFWSQNRFYCQQILMPRITPGVWGLKEEGVERGRNDTLASREGYNWRSESVFSRNNKNWVGCLVGRAEVGFHTKFQFSSFLSIAFLLRPICVRRSPECLESLRRIMIGIWSEGLEYHWVLLCFQAARMSERGVADGSVSQKSGEPAWWGVGGTSTWDLGAGGGVIHGSVQSWRNSPGPAEKVEEVGTIRGSLDQIQSLVILRRIPALMEFFASKALKEKRKRCSSCHSSLAKFYGRFISDSHFMLFFLELGRQPKPVLNTFERRTALLWNGKLFFSLQLSRLLFVPPRRDARRCFVSALCQCLGVVDGLATSLSNPRDALLFLHLLSLFPLLFFFHLNKSIGSKRHFKWVRQEGARVWFLYLSE